jgi:hypothetical protein
MRIARRPRELAFAALSAMLLVACSAGGAEGNASGDVSDDGYPPDPRRVPGLAGAMPDTGPPELPRTLLDTRLRPSAGRRITVAAGGDLQRSLDNAQPGDVVAIAAGAEFVGPFVLPKKEGTGWITIRSDAPDSVLPPEGNRITPAYSPRLPKLITRNSGPALRTEPGAHHYRIIAVEIAAAASDARNYGIVELGAGGRVQRGRESIPHDLIFDRVYLHGHPALSTRRCLALNSASTAVIDSYLADCHDRGFDSQAIGGWNGPGPFKIVNNHLEGAGENVMFGGGDPGIHRLVPSDIEIRRNHFYKPLAWRGRWTVKNLFELKNAHRVLVEGNVFENNWVDGQSGFALVFKSANQDGGAPWSETRDVVVRRNRIVNSASGVDIMAQGSNIDTPANHILLRDNVFERIGGAELGGSGRLWQVTEDPFAITFDHNTGFTPGHLLMLDEPQKSHVVISNNLVSRGEYGIFGSGRGEGNTAISYFLPGAVVTKNVIIGASAAIYPVGNFFPATPGEVGFVDFARGDYRLAPQSRYKRAASDGRDIGADIDAVTNATSGVVTR